MGGGYCTPCKDQTKADPVGYAAVGGDAPVSKHRRSNDSRAGSKGSSKSPGRSPGRSARGRSSHKGTDSQKMKEWRSPGEDKEEQQGQRRADLTVKAGGFALKNFMPTNNGTLEDNIEIKKEKLGEGGFGAVRQGKDKRTNTQCAVKSMRKNDKVEISKLKEEIEIMRLLDHPNIIRFMETFEDRFHVFLVMELCSGGELFDRICQAGSLQEGVASHVAWQMLLAVNYLHQNYITHRDLKPENWLVSTKQDIKSTPLKLIDFGISRRFEPGVCMKTKAGTPNYVAPEVLLGKYDEKADIWSLGVILYVMLSGTHPFSGKKVEQVLSQVKQARISMDGSSWKRVSAEAKGLVKVLLQKLVSSRPAAKQSLQHAWFETHAVGHESAAATELEVRGLEAFGRMNQLKRAVLTVIATQLSQENIEHLNEIFMAMDHNSDGTLSIKELKEGLTEASVMLPIDINSLLEQVDTDGSGVVDYTEFLAATMDKKVYHQESVVWNAFKKFDLDNSGAIDRKELGKLLGDGEIVEVMHLKGKRDRLTQIFEQVDVNGDGQIDFEEFFRMMRMCERGPRKGSKDGARCDIGIACQDEPEMPDSPKSGSGLFKSSKSLFLF